MYEAGAPGYSMRLVSLLFARGVSQQRSNSDFGRVIEYASGVVNRNSEVVR